jgi:tRNA pseudouridine65 synthase
MRITPQTGRRHQIRRHFKHIAHPLVGDTTHGKSAHNRAVAAWLQAARLWLHADAIGLPASPPLRIQAPCGPEWQALLQGLPPQALEA